MKKILTFILSLILMLNLCTFAALAEETAYSIDNIKYTYDGTHAYAVTAKKTLTITADVTKNTNENASVMLIAALYKVDGSMMGMKKSKSFTLSKGETKNISLEYTLPSGVNSRNNHIRVYCVSGGDSPVIYDVPAWQSEQFAEVPKIIEETTHITVHNEKRQTFKGMGVSDNIETIYPNEEGHEEATRLLYSQNEMGFNLYRLWGSLSPVSFDYNPQTYEVSILEGLRSFKRNYVDSGMIEKVEKHTNNNAQLFLTPSGDFGPEFREKSALNIELNVNNALQVKNVDINGDAFTNIKNGAEIIYGDLNNVRGTLKYIAVNVASKDGGEMAIYNADTSKKLASFKIEPTGGDNIYKMQYFSRDFAATNVTKVKVEFTGNTDIFGGIKEVVIDGREKVKTSKIPDYALLLSNYIKALKTELNVNIDYVTTFNEPLFKFTPEQLRYCVKELRKALDKNGLQNVKILADDWAEIDELTIYAWKELLADKEALDAIAGVSFHSYATASPGYYEDAIEIFKAAGKEVWMTESSTTEVLTADINGNLIQASEQASRVINDLNHNVEYWIHFLGQRQSSVGGGQNSTFLTGTDSYKENKNVTTNGVYDYYRQIRGAFEYGAVFRYCTSTEYGDMSRPRGKKTPVNVTYAQNTDGTYALAAINSSEERLTPEGWAKQNDHLYAITENLEIYIEELASIPKVEFDIYRSGKGGINVYEGTVTAVNGRLNLTLSTHDLVTLRSK